MGINLTILGNSFDVKCDNLHMMISAGRRESEWLHLVPGVGKNDTNRDKLIVFIYNYEWVELLPTLMLSKDSIFDSRQKYLSSKHVIEMALWWKVANISIVLYSYGVFFLKICLRAYCIVCMILWRIGKLSRDIDIS